MKREFSMLMKAPEGGRRLTRSHNEGSSCKSVKEHVYRIGGGVAENEAVRIENDVNTANLSDISCGSLNAGSPVQVSVGGNPDVNSQGRVPKKYLGMHKKVLAEVVPDGAELRYVVQGKIQLVGFKKDGGIYCQCCDTVFSPSQFEAHAGYASRRKPYDNIFTSNGLSLRGLSLKISRNDFSTAKQNDYVCYMCDYGGDMMFCKTCPLAFHAECVGLSSAPLETWKCTYCQDMSEKAKLVEGSSNGTAAGRVPSSNPLKEITQWCISVVETSMPDIGGCAICSVHDFTKKAFDDQTVIISDQALSVGDWFCCD